MKLAEALLLRSDQQKKLASLKQRINANVLVQEGDEPSEDPNELIKQVFALTQGKQSIDLSYSFDQCTSKTGRWQSIVVPIKLAR